MTPPRIIIVPDVSAYRRAARSLIKPGDHVLEIGCGAGRTTEIVAAIASRVLAVDKSRAELARARERLADRPNVRLLLADANDVRTVLREVAAFLEGRVDVLMVDIGGSEDPAKVFALVRRYIAAAKPGLVIVKNSPLLEFVKSATPWEGEPRGT